MSKKLRDYPLYLAPEIIGILHQGEAYAFVENNGKRLDPYDTLDKIIIYENQVNGWFLDRAFKLKRGKNNGFIILMICLSYLEGVEQYRVGHSSNGNSRRLFINALGRLYPNKYSEANLVDFYSQARCGLFHNGMTNSKIIYSYNFNAPINFLNNSTIQVNPTLLLKDIRKDFRDYIKELKREGILQSNFDNMFTVV